MEEPRPARWHTPISTHSLHGALPATPHAPSREGRLSGGAMAWLTGVLARLEVAAPRLGLTPDVLNFVGLGFGIFSGALISCLFGRWISSVCGAPSGSLLVVVLIAIALGTFATAVYRTSWIARRLRSHPA